MENPEKRNVFWHAALQQEDHITNVTTQLLPLFDFSCQPLMSGTERERPLRTYTLNAQKGIHMVKYHNVTFKNRKVARCRQKKEGVLVLGSEDTFRALLVYA